jgi:DNA-binding IclR family transcriptional regulator
VKAAKESILTVVPQTESEAVDLKTLIEGAKIPRATVQRAVDELLQEGKLARIGEGKRGKPFKYLIAEMHSCPTSDI